MIDQQVFVKLFVRKKKVTWKTKNLNKRIAYYTALSDIIWYRTLNSTDNLGQCQTDIGTLLEADFSLKSPLPEVLDLAWYEAPQLTVICKLGSTHSLRQHQALSLEPVVLVQPEAMSCGFGLENLLNFMFFLSQTCYMADQLYLCFILFFFCISPMQNTNLMIWQDAFTLLFAGYVCISLKPLEFYSGIQLIGNSLILSEITFRLCQWAQSSIWGQVFP